MKTTATLHIQHNQLRTPLCDLIHERSCHVTIRQVKVCDRGKVTERRYWFVDSVVVITSSIVVMLSVVIVADICTKVRIDASVVIVVVVVVSVVVVFVVVAVAIVIVVVLSKFADLIVGVVVTLCGIIVATVFDLDVSVVIVVVSGICSQNWHVPVQWPDKKAVKKHEWPTVLHHTNNHTTTA